MVPSTRISIQQRRRFDSLSPILAPLAFKSIVGFAKSVLVELKELPESINREVPFGVFFLVDDSGGQGLFIGLSLEDFLFDCSGRNETINKT